MTVNKRSAHRVCTPFPFLGFQLHNGVCFSRLKLRAVKEPSWTPDFLWWRRDGWSVEPKWRQFRSLLKRHPPIALQPISRLVPFPKCFRPLRSHIKVKAARELLDWVGGEDLAETKYDLSMFYIHSSKPTVVRMENLWFLVRVEDEIASL